MLRQEEARGAEPAARGTRRTAYDASLAKRGMWRAGRGARLIDFSWAFVLLGPLGRLSFGYHACRVKYESLHS